MKIFEQLNVFNGRTYTWVCQGPNQSFGYGMSAEGAYRSWKSNIARRK